MSIGVLDAAALVADSLDTSRISRANPDLKSFDNVSKGVLTTGDGLHLGSDGFRRIAAARVGFLLPAVASLTTAALSFSVTALPAGAIPPDPTPWAPDNAGITEATLRADWDANGGAYADEAHTTLCTNGQAAAAWWDAGRSVGAFQSSAGLRPIYRTGIQNGKPGIEFTGTEFLDATAALLAYITEPLVLGSLAPKSQTVFLVGKRTETTGNLRCALTAGNSAAASEVPTRRWGITGSQPEQVKCGDSAGTFTSRGLGQGISTPAFVACFQSSGTLASCWVWRNGVEVPYALNHPFQILSALTANNVTIGAKKQSGGNVFPWIGHLLRLVVYDGVLTSTSRRNVGKYLADDRGI